MSSPNEPSSSSRDRIEHRVATAIASVFVRYPHLTGFVLQDPPQAEGALSVVDAGFAVEMTEAAREKVLEQIRATVTLLLSERPEAADLLRERTFARSFH